MTPRFRLVEAHSDTDRVFPEPCRPQVLLTMLRKGPRGTRLPPTIGQRASTTLGPQTSRAASE